MKKQNIFLFAILGLIFFFHSTTRIKAVELITNGSFEDASPLQGWTRVNSPSPWQGWQNTTANFGGGYLSVAPTSICAGCGTKNVWNGMTDQATNNSQWSLYQDVTIPAGVTVNVSWRDRYQINHTQFCPGGPCQPKHYYVEIVNPTNNQVLQTLHTQSTIGNVNQDTGWVSRLVNITFPGQTVRLRFRGFETVLLSGPGQIEIDLVSMETVAPTSSNVPVRGRILNTGNSGIAKVAVTLTDASGNARTIYSNSFGQYRFDEVPVGQTYILTVNHRKYMFPDSPRILTVDDKLTDIDFQASP
jgi:hypothetical protein